MEEFMNLEYFAYICVSGEGDDKYWVFSDDSMSDPVGFGELGDPYYLYVVGDSVCADVHFGDVELNTFQHQPGLYGFW